MKRIFIKIRLVSFSPTITMAQFIFQEKKGFLRKLSNSFAHGFKNDGEVGRKGKVIHLL